MPDTAVEERKKREGGERYISAKYYKLDVSLYLQLRIPSM